MVMMVLVRYQSMRLLPKALAPNSLHPPAGEVAAVQQRLSQLRISLDPLKSPQGGFPLPRRGPNSEDR